MSTNLGAPALSGGQVTPEITVNDAVGRLDAAVTETLVVDLTNSVTLTTLQYQTAMRFSITPTGSAKTLTLPAVKRLCYIGNDGTLAISVVKGSTSISLAAATGGFFYTDGTTNGLIQLASSGAGGGALEPFDLATYVLGTPIANQVLLRFKAVRAFTWASALSGSQFSAGVAATASYTVTIKQNGSSIGTLVWAAAGTTPTVTFSSTVNFAAGDLIEIIAPATPDATLAQIALDFSGTRPNSTALVPADMGIFVPGKPGAGATILRFKAVRSFIWIASLTGSNFTAGTASAATATFTLKKNGSAIGTVAFSTSATGAATFASDVFFVAGDVIEIIAPGSQDTTLADVAFNILGSR
jgi:hypothetical protein